MGLQRSLQFDLQKIIALFDAQSETLAADPIIARGKEGEAAKRLKKARAHLLRLPTDTTVHDENDVTLFDLWWSTVDPELIYPAAHVLLSHLRPATQSTTVYEGDLALDGGFYFCPNDLHVTGSVLCSSFSALIVAGSLTIDKALVSDLYECHLVIADSLSVAEGATVGDLIIPGEMSCTGRFYFANNDYGSRIGRFRGGILVDFEQDVVYGECSAEFAIHEWEWDFAAQVLHGTESASELAAGSATDNEEEEPDPRQFFEVLAQRYGFDPDWQK